MNIWDRKGLKRSAADALGRAQYDPKKLMLIHTGASVGLALLIALIDWVLDEQIGGTGGLGGIGTRAVLETVQSVLMGGQMIALIFWQIGFTYAALGISRRQPRGPESLLEGFRQFGPVIRLRLITTLLYGGAAIGCAYLAAIIFTFTGLGADAMAIFESGTEEQMLAAMDEMMGPMMLVYGAVMLVVLVPYWYRLRLADHALMDAPKAGAMAAIRTSRKLMKGNRIHLLKLDVSFWWFYGLELLTMVLAYGDWILPAFGVELPWSAEVSYYVFMVLCYLAQLMLYWWKGSDVQVTYALAYQSLLPKEEAQGESVYLPE